MLLPLVILTEPQVAGTPSINKKRHGMRVYVWARSTSQSAITRCHDLINKAFGAVAPAKLIDMVQQVHPETDEDLGVFGVPIGAGSEAGLNAGAGLLQSVISSVVANAGEYNARLTTPERLELLGFVATAEDIDAAWYYDSTVHGWQYPIPD